MTSRNEIYITSLIDYINDVKPFHVKLTEVVEEHQFFDTVNVHVSDQLNTSIYLNSIWSFDNYYSDGLRTRYALPPFLTPRYSTDVGNYRYTTSGALDYLKTNFGINNAFQVNSSQGLESALIDGKAGIEGYDYYLSKGIYSIQTTSTTWNQTNSNIIENGAINWISTNPWMQLTDLVVPAGHESLWRVDLEPNLDVKHVYFTGAQVQITLENQAAPNVFYETYENNQLVIPDSVVQVPGQTITFSFTHSTLRVIKITSEDDLHVFNFDAPITTWTIDHTLNTTQIIPQIYALVNGLYTAILPLSTEIVSASQIVINFTVPTAGKVILRDVPNQISFTNVYQVDIPNVGQLVNYAVFLEQGSPAHLIYTMITAQIFPTFLRITFGSPYSGVVNYMMSVEPKAQFTVTDIVTNTLVGVGVIDEPFVSSVLSFTPAFGGFLDGGSSTFIRPGNKIAVTSTAIDQIWSIIKINPISYQRPVSYQAIRDPQTSVITGYTLASLGLNLIPFAPAFNDAPAEDWIITFNGVDFDVYGSVSSTSSNGSNCFATAKIGPWYDNGIVRFKLALDPSLNFPFKEQFVNNASYQASYHQTAVELLAHIRTGDRIIITVNATKPNYIVYGSETKQLEFATVGEYFWNGQIGFMPDLPYYSITPVGAMQPGVIVSDPTLNTGLMRNMYYDEYPYGETYDTDILSTVEGQNTVNSNPTWFLLDHYPAQWNIKLGVPLVQQGLSDFYTPATIEVNFYKPPRFDATDERFDLTFNQYVTSGPQQFFVTSDKVGPLPGALVGYAYTNFETATVSLTYGNAGAFNMEIVSNAAIPVGTHLTVGIKSNFIKPFHSRDVVIIDPSVSYTNLLLRTFNNDVLELNIQGTYPELGIGNGYGKDTTIQTFLMPNITNVQANEGYDYTSYDSQPYEQLQIYGETLNTSVQPLMPSRLGTYDLLLNNSPFANAGTISYQEDTTTGLFYCVIDFTTNFLDKYLPTNTKFSFTSHQTDEYNHLATVMVTETLKITDIERQSESILPTVTDGELTIIDRTVSLNTAGGKDAIIYEKIAQLPSNLTGYDMITYDEQPFDIFSDSIPYYTFANTDYPSPGVKCWYRIYEYNVTELMLDVPNYVYDNNANVMQNNIVLLANYVDTQITNALDNTVTLIEGTDYVIEGIDYTGLGFLNIPQGSITHHSYQIQFTLTQVPRYVIVMLLDYSSIPQDLF